MLTVADKAGDALRNERSDFIREKPRNSAAAFGF